MLLFIAVWWAALVYLLYRGDRWHLPFFTLAAIAIVVFSVIGLQFNYKVQASLRIVEAQFVDVKKSLKTGRYYPFVSLTGSEVPQTKFSYSWSPNCREEGCNCYFDEACGTSLIGKAISVEYSPVLPNQAGRLGHNAEVLQGNWEMLASSVLTLVVIACWFWWQGRCKARKF